MPERMKNHSLARIIHPGVEAEFFHAVPEGTGYLNAFSPCCSREEEAFLVLPRETPSSIALTGSVRKAKRFWPFLGSRIST